MISVLAQERLLGAALGCAFTGFLVFDQRRCIYKSVSDIRQRPVDSTREMVPDRETSIRSDMAHLWNKTVDKTLGPLIHALSSRGW